MATKTVINCMEHSITQPNQGISIIIDQHTDDQQQVYNASSNSNIIKIQHSNEQSLQQQPHQPHQHQQYFTLNNRNNKNNKTLIDINRNDDDLHYDPLRVVAAKNEHVLQINCSSTSNDISREIKEMLENTQTEAIQLEYNGVLTERGNDRNDNHHNEVQCNGEKKFNLANNEDGHNKDKNYHEEADEFLTKYSTQQRVEEDEEESGQTASQQQKAQQQVQHNGNGNGNSKHRENGQNSTTNQLKLQLTTSTTADRNNDEEHKDDNEKQPNNDDYDGDDDDDHTKTQDHYEVTNREDDNDDDSSSSSSGIGSGCAISSGAVGLVQREVVDFSHGKRSLNEENSNSLLTKADASTCTKSTTLLTINANTNTNAHTVATQNDLNNFENLTKDKKINHVVKIQIKPNNNSNNNSDCNTLTEKQITVVKIENLQEFENETTKTTKQNNNNHKENLASENIENKENQKENTLHSQSQLNDATTMVQKPSNNSAATVTVVSTNSNANGNGNLNTVSHTSGTVTAATGTTVTELNVSNPNNYLYYMMSSGQFSPCDTLDSGTGSDLESNGQQQQSLPNLQIKKSSNSSSSSTSSSASNNSLAPLELHLKTTKIRVNNSSSNSLEMQQRQCSFTDSEESEASSLSCDSLHSNEFLRQSSTSPIQLQKTTTANGQSKKIQSFLPDSLLREIKNLKFSSNDYEAENEEEDDILPTLKSEIKSDVYEPLSNKDYIKSHEFIQSRKNLNNLPTTMSSSLKRASLPSKTFVLNTEDGTFIDTKMNSMPRTYEADKYYNFHVNEHDNFRSFGNNGSMTAGSATNGENGVGDSLSIADYETKSLHDDVFAGYRDLRCVSNTSTIRSSKGTVRGVKNRVRNGIATFLQLQQPNIKNYKEKDSGKVVLYTTSMGIIRDTYAKCSNVKQILRTLLVKFEERDVFMSVEYQQEIKERMHSDIIKVPQLYVEGQHIGDADTVERLNESGELRQLLKPYKSISTTYTCQTCGGYRLLPCPSCNGSKKSVHRNHFTAEFVALKCMNCDEVGLVKCHNC